MFRFIRQSVAAKKVNSSSKEKLSHSNAAVTKSDVPVAQDRRIYGSERVMCNCSFDLPKPDVGQYSTARLSGLMKMNMQGCCVYLKSGLTSDQTQSLFPDGQLVTLSNLMLIKRGVTDVNIKNLSVRRVRLLSDEHGPGIVLRFENLDESQFCSLGEICN